MNYNIIVDSEEKRAEALNIISKLDISNGYNVVITEDMSISQQALYWIWLTCMEDETGTERGEIHEHLKEEFNDGESTTNLDKFNMQKYMMKVNAWASSEFMVYLPSPGDNGFQAFFDKYSKYKKKS